MAYLYVDEDADPLVERYIRRHGRPKTRRQWNRMWRHIAGQRQRIATTIENHGEDWFQRIGRKGAKKRWGEGG